MDTGEMVKETGEKGEVNGEIEGGKVRFVRKRDRKREEKVEKDEDKKGDKVKKGNAVQLSFADEEEY